MWTKKTLSKGKCSLERQIAVTHTKRQKKSISYLEKNNIPVFLSTVYHMYSEGFFFPLKNKKWRRWRPSLARPAQLPRTKWEPLVDTTKRKHGAVVSESVEVVCSTPKLMSRDFPLIWPSSVKNSHMETVGVEVTYAVSSKILEGTISQWKTLKTLMGKGKLAEL